MVARGIWICSDTSVFTYKICMCVEEGERRHIEIRETTGTIASVCIAIYMVPVDINVCSACHDDT